MLDTPSVGPITLQGPGWVQSVAFQSLQVSERLGAPFQYELEVLSDRGDLHEAQLLGEPVTVSLEVQTEKRHFNGIATSIKSLGAVGDSYVYRVMLHPWLWLLSKAANCRIFQAKSVPDIIKAVFRAHGFSDFEEALTGSYPAREYVVQYRETDLYFVQRLMEHEGIYYFFKHEEEKHTLVLCDSPSSHGPTPFYESLPYFPPDRNRNALFDYLERWETLHEVRSGGVALTDYDFEHPKASLLVTKKEPPTHAYGEFEVFDYPGTYKETKGGEGYARLRLEEAQATRERCEADGNARGLLVGSLFTLSEHAVEAANREYLVIAQELTLRGHDISSGGARGEEVCRCHVVAIPSDGTFRPARGTPKPIVAGAQTATVVGEKGEEITTDKYGRVKLRFHWDRDSPGDETSSCWVRVAQIWAGTHFGAIHIPRIGQEVIVEFLEGDPDRPIVTGRVYNFGNMPPYELPLHKTQSGIKSRSTLEGNQDNCNEIRFEDKKGSEELFIQAEKDQNTKVKNDQSIRVDGSRSISVGGEQSTTVTGNETQTYEADRKMTVAGTDTETITGAHSGTYETGRTITVSGAEDVLEVRGVNRRTTVEGKYVITTTNQYQVTNGNNVLLLQGAKASITNGQCTISFDGGNAKIEAPGKLEISCGQSKITLTPTELTVSAVKVGLDGSGLGKLDLEAAGCTLAGPKTKVEGAGMTEIVGAMVKIN